MAVTEPVCKLRSGQSTGALVCHSPLRRNQRPALSLESTASVLPAPLGIVLGTTLGEFGPFWVVAPGAIQSWAPQITCWDQNWGLAAISALDQRRLSFGVSLDLPKTC